MEDDSDISINSFWVVPIRIRFHWISYDYMMRKIEGPNEDNEESYVKDKEIVEIKASDLIADWSYVRIILQLTHIEES